MATANAMTITITAAAIYVVNSEVLTKFCSGEAVGACVGAADAIVKTVSVLDGQYDWLPWNEA